MRKTKKTVPRQYAVDEGVGGFLFALLLSAGWLLGALMAALFIENFGGNISDSFAEFNTQVYWLNHFSRLPSIRHDAVLYLAGIFGNLLVLLIGFAPLLLIALTTIKTVRRKGFTMRDVTTGVCCTVIALLVVISWPQY